VRISRASLPYVVWFAENESSASEAGGADVCERGVTDGAAQTRRVPVAVDGVEQVPVQNVRPAPRTPLHRRRHLSSRRAGQ